MSRLLLIGMVVAMTSGMWTADAMAQRDAGAKARGEFGTGFWNPQHRRPSSGAASYQPSQPRGETYRRFSYEPVGIHPGDTVVLNGDNVKMMKGTVVVGAVPNGQEFKVTKVVNGWLGAVVEVDGRKLTDWVWHKNVSLEE
jgi:hypothetical protein